VSDNVSGAPVPKIFGGMAFAAGAAQEPAWSDFGDGSFVLPRWTYERTHDRGWLSLAVDGARHDEADRHRLHSEFDLISHALSGGPQVRGPVPPVLEVEHLDYERFRTEIDAIRHGIAEGHLEKVVAARRSVVELADEVDPVVVLGRLRDRFGACSCFAIRRQMSTFLGATPERLVSRRGSRVETEALAGSIRAGAADSAARLLASDKDRREQDYVVQDIVGRLGPLCTRLSYAQEPHVRAFPHVLHMSTPIHGELSPSVDFVNLLEALHPTPAVGGVPAERALNWIAQREAAPRGWYAGPFGWIDANGDGDMAVALRSGLLRGRTAWVYAGAGVVRDSEAEAEYAETDLKLRALLGALGSEGAAGSGP